ncbi:TIGR00299 family protein [Sulfobacillus thermotolerans]|uniref:Pyridinium-3,5-bisthiocarboxylic acid mononucleotide nickel insertion protein n=1 Tax=Sulfobacillus thermotolerans TaxID=338644 RepID=A0ABM6RNZ7_9FIRM|nr:TIGR00299 family protein [Sulfobacillus thermotolerans]
MNELLAYLECPAGVSGNMFLGAWLDAGVAEDRWREMLASLMLKGVSVNRTAVYPKGIQATFVDVVVDEEAPWYETHPAPESTLHPHRHWAEIDALLTQAGGLPEIVKTLSRRAFRLLAEAEGAVHGVPAEEVHFHEVGAYDAIIDVVGAFCGWYLAGMPRCYVSPIEVGGGTVSCAHGRLPVPAPAVARLLQGFVTYSSGNWGETVTPTGAAILRALVEHSGSLGKPVPPMRDQRGGYGAGSREFPVANVFRIRMGQAVRSRDDASVVELSANIDDMSPEWMGDIIDVLLKQGALDAWVTPVVMKKGRPGWIVSALTDLAQEEFVTEVMLRQTTTLGVRRMERQRTVLERSWEVVSTPYGAVRMKIAGRHGQIWNAAPEYEDCRRQAHEAGVPLKDVYQAAWSAFQQPKTEDDFDGGIE